MVSDTAVWEMGEGVWDSAIEVNTPLAQYMFHPKTSSLVSIVDKVGGGQQWVDFSYGFRPNRGIPNLGPCCKPGVPEALGHPVFSTVQEERCSDAHVRFRSESLDGEWLLVWDFYTSHVVLTIEEAPAVQFGFTYAGVPAGALNEGDLVIQPGKEPRPANLGFPLEFDGGPEWAAVGDPGAGVSLFVLQHHRDEVRDEYSAADGDTARLQFSKDHSPSLPVRYSFGLVDSTDPTSVGERVGFVLDETP